MRDARGNYATDTIYFKDFFNFADQMHAMETYVRGISILTYPFAWLIQGFGIVSFRLEADNHGRNSLV